LSEEIFSHCNVSDFASFTFFEDAAPVNSAVFMFSDSTGKTVVLSTSLQVAAEMRALLNKAFAQMEMADLRAHAAAVTAPEQGSKPH
jgi:hypothetical protein